MIKILAWALALLAGALAITAFGLEISGPPAATDSAGFIGLQSFFAVVFAASGLVITLRRPANVIGWIFAVEGPLWGEGGVVTQVIRRGHDADALGGWGGLLVAYQNGAGAGSWGSCRSSRSCRNSSRTAGSSRGAGPRSRSRP